MSTQANAILGVAFLVVGLGAMFLMYHLWGYPFDKATRTSAAPRWAMRLHRVLGWTFVVIYVVLMIQMVPRLWRYQVELPARTVVHLVLGFGIGFLLLVKIAIIRFFRHLEEWMPYLGTAVMAGTLLLLGLSLPAAVREHALASPAFSDENRARVARLLPEAGLPADADLAFLASADGLRAGRTVLTTKCVACHDMRTILAQPRTPSGWGSLVERMGEKPSLFTPLAERDLWVATAYLIAITPELQRSRRRQREEAEAQARARAAADAPPPAAPTVDLAVAKGRFETKCSQCHELSDVDDAPPKDPAEATALVKRMITDNDAELTMEDVSFIEAYLVAHYVEKKR
jgi:mono/diheme cytochrome c family protein